MDNIALTSSSQTSPHTGNPLNPLPIPPLASEPPSTTTIETLIPTPLEPIEQIQTDGNIQAHVDVNYQAHDVALVSVKSNGQQQEKKVLTSTEHQKVLIHDNDEYPDKVKSCCSMLNKLFLALAIVCFALFLCSLAYIIANLEGLNGKYDGRSSSRLNNFYMHGDDLSSSERLINEPYFNLTHPTDHGLIVVLARRGASVSDVLLPIISPNGTTTYRSIVLQGGSADHLGSVRFGFDDSTNSNNMINQLPTNYPFLNYYSDDWAMYADKSRPYRVRFVQGFIQIIYEISMKNPNEFSMTSMVATPSNQQIIADPTNNIYFNLRGYGNLSTHYLNLSLSNPINIINGQKIEQDRLIQSQQVDKLNNVNSYFYRLNRAGLGKNYVATLSESESKTTMHVFSDHAGVTIDPHGAGVLNENIPHVTTVPDVRGVRISPRQSPIYQPMSIYGPTLVSYPSQAVHTTWWQFAYEN